MDPRIAPLYEIFKLNSRIYLNCLDGMDDDQASWRLSDSSNSVAYIALHLVNSRFHVAKLAGLALENPFAALVKDAKGIGDLTNLPSLEELRDAWKAVTGAIRERLKLLGEADLKQDTGTKLPVDDKSLLGVLGFMMQHDSYHIGQLALLRKQVGLPAMSYR